MTKTTTNDLAFIKNLLGGEAVIDKTVNVETTEAKVEAEVEKETQTQTTETETTQTETQTETQTQTEISANKYDDIFRDKLGYNSIDEFIKSDSIDKVKNYDTLIERIKNLEIENNEIINEASSLNNPFANEQIFKLNHLLTENPNIDISIASKLLSSDLNSMSALDKIKLAMQVENPEFTDRHINKKLKNMFGVEDVAELYDAELSEDIRLDLDIHAKEAVKTLDRFKISGDMKYEEKFIPEKIRAKISENKKAIEVSAEEVDMAWTPAVTHLKNTLNEIPIPIFDSKENKTIDGNTKYVLSENDKEFVAKFIMNEVQTKKIKEITPEIIDTLNVLIWEKLIARNIHKITQTVADKARSEEFRRLKAERDGVDTQKIKDKSDKDNVVKNGIDIVLNAPERTWRNIK